MWDNPKRGYDRVVVKALINLIGVYPVGTCVILDTLEVAVVAGPNPDAPQLNRPLVRIAVDVDGATLPLPGNQVSLAEKDESGAYQAVHRQSHQPCPIRTDAWRLLCLSPAWRRSGPASSSAGRTALIPYLTAGYPTPAESAAALRSAAEVADIIEVGVPFSDPLADGPTIQRSTFEALRQGMTLAGTLDLIAQAELARAGRHLQLSEPDPAVRHRSVPPRRRGAGHCRPAADRPSGRERSRGGVGGAAKRSRPHPPGGADHPGRASGG